MKATDSTGRCLPQSILLLLTLLLIMFVLPDIGNAFNSRLEGEIQKDLEHSRALVSGTQAKNQKKSSISHELRQLKASAENIRAAHLLLEEQFRLRQEKVKTVNTIALARHQAMWKSYQKTLTEYLSLIDRLPDTSDNQESDISSQRITIDNLKGLLEKMLPKKKHPILGTLPYKNLNYPARGPGIATTIIPAYRGGNKTVTAGDTTGTAEAPITLEIATLAQTLNWSPVSIYEYVKNNIETEWYWGCMKGAEETLHQKSGNDCDQAALLVALLRASGYPTRYVRGAIEFFPDIETAKNLTGIADPAKLGEFFQKAGIPYQVVMNGPTINAIQIEHLWIETFVPYSNYRGAVIDDQGKTWIGLDTSIKASGYAYNTVPDIVSEYSLSTSRDDYLGTTQTQTPLGFLQANITSYLSQNHPGTTYADYLGMRSFIPEVMQILPSSLQFKDVAITGEYTAIPSDLIHKVTFSAKDRNNIGLFSITLDAMKLSNRKVMVSYEPETIDDQEIINSFGGIDSTPCYLVQLRPVLLIDDERIVVASEGIAMGGDYDLTISVVSPNGTETFTNTMISGNLTAVALVSQKTMIPTDIDEQEAGNLLNREALRYIDNWNKGEEELASLLHVVINRPIPTVVAMGGLIDVAYLLDQPHEFTWKGLYLDADLRTVEAVQSSEFGVQSERKKLFMQLSALQGSVLEHTIFEDDFQVLSISTAKLFGRANSAQPVTPILSIDQANIAAVLPTLPFAQNIVDDIADAVNNQNLVVRIPQSELSYEDWTGIGYIKENCITGEAGYMLSGMVAGGMTAVSPSKWTNQAFVDILNKPYKDSSKGIMILAPVNESTVSTSPIDVTGIVLGANSAVTINGVAAEVTGNTFTAYSVKLKPWTNVITATGTNAKGEATRDTIAVTYKIPLQVYISFPYDGASIANTPIFIEGAVSDPTAIVTVSNVAATVLADGRFTASGVPLSEGANPVTVTALNRVGEKATNTITLNYHAVDPQPALSVSITSPASGATVNNQSVTVSGTVTTAAQEMSIRVNGVLAEVYNGQFAANNVPMVEGSNIIIADTMDANGAIARSQISVNANTTVPSVTLSSNIQSGVAPLTTYFSLQTNITTSITGYQLDFGDGSAPYAASTFEYVSHIFTSEGILHPTVTVTDSKGNTYTDTITIIVLNKAVVDTLLKNKWEGMKAALLAGDTEGALIYFVDPSKDRYRQIFTTIGSININSIFANITELHLDTLYGQVAQYWAFRAESSGTFAYPITFIQEVRGAWKIMGF